MPWEKQFDTDIALERAMETFWVDGYEATSMQALLDRMRINRGSFYDTFSSKRGIFLEALKRYDARERAAAMQAAKEGRAPKETIGEIFAAAAGSRRGCLLVNSALELAPRDADVAAVVQRAFAETEKFFHTMIEEGQATREINSDLDPEETARELLGLLLGLRVLTRAAAPESVVASLAQRATALLE